jgi:BirA family transcriptional regulator, biotin operon repressor / biotin---[acetyl-CoA-carboxylase] ligase
MMKMSDERNIIESDSRVDPSAFTLHSFGRRHIGRQTRLYERLESSNDLALRLADDPANHGLVILAEEQTAGRGQQGRRWLTPPGQAVLMSVLLFPPPALCRPALLIAWAAVSVCETIRQISDIQSKIKWPNDVLLRGRKVCGILLESRSMKDEGGRMREEEKDGRGEMREEANAFHPSSFIPPPSLAVVAGIGLNVNQSREDFAKASLPDATSLALTLGRTLDAHTVARLLVEQLDEEYARLLGGDRGALEACWKWHVGLLGKSVVLETSDGRHWGRLRDITLDSLELEQDTGRIRCFTPESVRHLASA